MSNTLTIVMLIVVIAGLAAGALGVDKTLTITVVGGGVAGLASVMKVAIAKAEREAKAAEEAAAVERRRADAEMRRADRFMEETQTLRAKTLPPR